jgi:modulator of FtsH protease HflK
MAWNDPGNGKDPWKRDDDEPTDLDRMVRDWRQRLGSLLGGGGGGRPGGGGGGYALTIMLLVAWAATGFYRIDEAERGVVQRFGAFTETTLPGWHWHIPYPIENVDRVNAYAVSNYAYRTEMLTADEQYVYIDMVVQYRRTDPVKYSFNVVDPEQTLQDVTESALREVVGTTTLEVLVTTRRDEIASRTSQVLQNTLDNYGAGITVTSISLESVNYPSSVQDAVDDAQKARNDSERYELEADEYERDVVPKARGKAAQILEDAKAYHDRVIADAEGESARFEALLTQYQKSPRVTRERLYIDALEDVYGRSNKVFLDAEGSGNLLYLPLDKMLQDAGSRPMNSTGTRAADTAAAPTTNSGSEGDSTDPRERRTRQ